MKLHTQTHTHTRVCAVRISGTSGGSGGFAVAPAANIVTPVYSKLLVSKRQDRLPARHSIFLSKTKYPLRKRRDLPEQKKSTLLSKRQDRLPASRAMASLTVLRPSFWAGSSFFCKAAMSRPITWVDGKVGLGIRLFQNSNACGIDNHTIHITQPAA